MDITKFTTAQAQNRLQADGLESLGLTSLQLAPRWGTALPAFDPVALTLSLAGAISPFLGMLDWLPHGHEYTDAQGLPINAPCGVIRLHPHAAQRLLRIASARYATVGTLVHPLPVAMLLRLAAVPDETPRRIEAGDTIPAPIGGVPLPAPLVVSFHDARGLIICPVAVAAMFADLTTGLPALLYAKAAGAKTDAGGLNPIAALATGNLVQFCDLHGGLYQPTLGTTLMNVVTAAPPGTTPVNHASGYALLAAGQTIAADADDGGVLRFGFATGGTLARTALALPALPGSHTAPPFASTAAPTLARQFLRVVVVDPAWHLLGNRITSARNGIPGDDANTPAALLPAVRDRVTINYTVDGLNTFAAVDGVLARFAAAGTGMATACSPAFASFGLPPAPPPGATVAWPAFPPASPGAPGTPTTVSPAVGATAAWLAAPSPDVVFTIPAAAVPKDAHVRIYQRRFIEIPSIGAQPSFVRGDGGAGIGTGGAPLQILLANPFGLGTGDPHPPGVELDVDIVVTARGGQRRLWSGIRLPVAEGGAPVVNNFGGTDRLGLIPSNMQGWCAVPLFGLPRTITPVGGGTLALLSRGLASESVPRTGPRLPLMARFETVVAAGIPDAGAANGALSWEAVLTGARWMPESRSAQHTQGNPGNPAGPDIHAAGVHVSGALAFDLGWHALRRAKPPLPFPGAPALLDGWLVYGAGNNMNEPATAATDAAGTSMGAALQTVAAICENPELSLAPQDAFDTPNTVQGLVDKLSELVNPGGTPPTINVANGDRLLEQIRREYFVARNGRRDALWSLRRALGEARELIYIEGAQFASTAANNGASPPHVLDLAHVIIDRMTAHKGLRVVVALPRQTDFAQSAPPMNFENFVQQALAARRALVAKFPAAISDRLAVFHPLGFPGRPTAIRTSVVIVDDVVALVGASHFRRRGMTFDGAADVVSFDRVIDAGYSKKLREFRRALMATRLGVPIGTGPGNATAEWAALERPRTAFSVVRNMLAQGGLGAIQPLWDGNNPEVIPASLNEADPDGIDGATLLGTLASFLNKG